VEKRNPHALLVGMQTGAATMENSMQVPQKVKNRTILGSSNRTTIYPKNTKNANSKGYMHSYVYSHISQDMEVAQVSID